MLILRSRTLSVRCRTRSGGSWVNLILGKRFWPKYGPNQIVTSFLSLVCIRFHEAIVVIFHFLFSFLLSFGPALNQEDNCFWKCPMLLCGNSIRDFG